MLWECCEVAFHTLCSGIASCYAEEIVQTSFALRRFQLEWGIVMEENNILQNENMEETLNLQEQPQDGGYQSSGQVQSGSYQGSGQMQDGNYQNAGQAQGGYYQYGGYQQSNSYPQNNYYMQNGYANNGYQNYNGNYQPYNNMPPYADSQLELEEPVKVSEWILSLVLMMLPCVNIIMMFIWAFSNTEKKSKSNFFKAALIMYGIMAVLMVMLWMVVIILAAI